MKLYFVWSHYNKCTLYRTVDFINVPFTAQYKFTAEGHVGMQKPSILTADELQRECYCHRFRGSD